MKSSCRKINQWSLSLAILLGLAITASAQTLPTTLPSSMPILTTAGGDTFSGNAVGSSTVTVGAFEYFLIGGGGGGGNAPGSDGQAQGGHGGGRVGGAFTLGAGTSLAVTVGGGGGINGNFNTTGGTGGTTTIAGVGSAGGGGGGASTGTNGGGGNGSTDGTVTGNNSYLYGARGAGGRNGSLTRFQGGASGGGDGAFIGGNTGNSGPSSGGAGSSGGGGGGGCDSENAHRNPSGGGSGRAFVQYYGNIAATSGGAGAYENAVNTGNDTSRYWDGSGAFNFTAAASQVAIFSGNLTGGTVTKSGLGTLLLNGDSSTSHVTANAGGLGAGLASGAIGDFASGNLTLNAGSTLKVDFTDASSDQINVTGAVNLNGATLALTYTGSAPACDYSPVLIANDGVDVVNGTFAGLAEGTVVGPFGGKTAKITYAGGDGNDVALIFNRTPVAACQAVQVIADGTCHATVYATDIDGGSTDADGNILTYLIDGQASIVLNALGTTTHTLTVSDGDCSSTCQAQVTVVDQSAPSVVTAPVAITVDADAVSCAVAATRADVAAWLTAITTTDNCDPNASVANNAPSSFPKGDTIVVWTVTDDTGNSTTVSSTLTVQDVTAPAIALNGDSPQIVECHSAYVEAGATASDNCDLVTVVVSGAVDTTTPGTYTVTYDVQDLAGNAAQAQRTVIVQDTTAPAIACQANVVVGNDAGDCSATGVALGTPIVSDVCDANVVVSNDAVEPFQKGDTIVTWTATDASGNSSTCEQTVTVVDVEAPVASCPGDIAVGCSSPDGAVVEFEATAADNCGSATVVCVPASGSTFVIGSTPVTCTATDEAALTASCTFTVTVSDLTAPTIVCGNDITVNNDAGICGAVVTYDLPTATDECVSGGSVPVTCAPASGSTFAVGQTTVTCSAADTAGNTASCTFKVNVADAEAPVIAAVGSIAVSTDAGLCSAVVAYATPSASDNCDASVAVTCSPASGSTFAKGVTTVTCNAADTAGNAATSVSFTVTVSDTENPVIACPASVTKVSNSGCAYVGAIGDATVSDNCPGVSVANNAPASFPIGSTVVTWTATDASGNTATCSQTVTVISKLTLAYLPPLAGQPVGNKIKTGQVVPHKVAIVNCTGSAITSGITVRLAVVGKATGPGGSDQEIAEDANGTGIDAVAATNDGIMVLTDSKYQFNLNTGNFPNNNTLADGVGGMHYEATATAYDNATGLAVGSVTVNLENRP